MAENLKVTRYSNGDTIPNVTDNTDWANFSTGAYCNYDNDSSNAAIYGRLYNWFVLDDSCNIAPAGWHVPTDEEWQTLVDFLGGVSVAGGKLKETGTSHWDSPNTGATNESGFSALPGGHRFHYDGTFQGVGTQADYWTATQDDSWFAWRRYLSFNGSGISHCKYDKQSGFSVRCVRD